MEHPQGASGWSGGPGDHTRIRPEATLVPAWRRGGIRRRIVIGMVSMVFLSYRSRRLSLISKDIAHDNVEGTVLS